MTTDVFEEMYPASGMCDCTAFNSSLSSSLKAFTSDARGRHGVAFSVGGSAPPTLVAAKCKPGTYGFSHSWIDCNDPLGTIKILTHLWRCNDDGEWQFLKTHEGSCIDAKDAEDQISRMKKDGTW